MKYIWTKAIAIAAVSATLALSSCVYENGDVVIKEHVCVNLDEYQTTGTFSSFVVCDKFKDALERKLALIVRHQTARSPADESCRQ